MVLFILGCMGCEAPSSEDFQRELGQISAFAEMVAAGVKPMALSTPMPPERMDQFEPLARREAALHGISVFRESELIQTDLFADSMLVGQAVLLICDSLTKKTYDVLKKDLAGLRKEGLYTDSLRIEIARRFGRLLGFTPPGINRLLASQTSFRTLSDFGVQATNLFWYYEDREAALAFYTGTLGLPRVADYDNSTILQIAANSYLTLVDDGKGMHTADEPKSVALALLTNQLGQWWEYLQQVSVNVKYPYKPRVGGPHDGFVIVDPEGYLLEFETFKQHPENEGLIPRLREVEDFVVDPTRPGAPEGLAFKGTVAWLYYRDVLAMERFMEQTMGFPLVVDQGWAKVYAASGTGYVGLVDEQRGMCFFTTDKAVNVNYWLSDVDGWWAYAKNKRPLATRSDSLTIETGGRFRTFVGYDPENYFLEFSSPLIE